GDLQPATAAELDQYETETTFKLPRSYREYCQLFGPGVLIRPHGFHIAVPGSASGGILTELRRFQAYSAEAQYEAKAYCSDPGQIRRAVFFATDIGTYFYYWDPQEVTDPAASECAVYVITRGEEIHRLADTFFSFVHDVCLGTGVPGTINDNIERIF